jgi:CRISPR-associated endoribonuclease Cas6
VPAVITLTLRLPREVEVYPARLHAAACALLEPAWVGHHDQHKPFSAWPLAGASSAARWRLGWLPDDPPAIETDRVAFGPHTCQILGCRVEQVRFAELTATPPAWRADLEFVSPLYFSRNGRDHPLPDPVQILRSAIDRWNAHAPDPLRIDDPTCRVLLGAVRLDAMAGETATTQVTATQRQVGFLGHARLSLPRHTPPPGPAVFAALLRYADIAGLGAQTTHGYGATTLHHPAPQPAAQPTPHTRPPTGAARPATPQSTAGPRNHHPPSSAPLSPALSGPPDHPSRSPLARSTQPGNIAAGQHPYDTPTPC